MSSKNNLTFEQKLLDPAVLKKANELGHSGLFASPKTFQEIEDYACNFNGGEKTAAIVVLGMCTNFFAKVRAYDDLNSISIDETLLANIRTEVSDSYDNDEMKSFKDFEAFFDQVDVQNSYEESWRPDLYKAYYEKIYIEHMGEQ